MQTYTEAEPRVNLLDINTTGGENKQPVRDVTAVLMGAALVSMIAVQIVKAFGLANGMDEHLRMTLSYVGFTLCFIAAPAILLYGKHMNIKTGLACGAGLIFVVASLASLVSL